MSIDLGFDPQGVITASLDPGLQGFEEGQWRSFFQELKDGLAAGPAVESVAYAGHLPLTLAINTTKAVPQRDRHLPQDERPDLDVVSVGAGYFQTIGIEILRGRPFADRDRVGFPWGGCGQ